MDRLIVMDPNQLVFDFEIGQKCSGFMTLKNVMLTMPVAFKMTGSPSKKYTIRPTQGIIPPAGRVVVEVIMNPQQAIPNSFPVSRDKFVVKSMVVPGGSNHTVVSDQWFENKKSFVYSDTGIKVVLVGDCILRSLVSGGTMEEVRELLETRVDLASRKVKASDQSPLHVAVSCDRPEMVQILLEFGANVEARDKSGQTPLHEAAASGQALSTELLLANGALTESRTESGGWTALHFAANGGHVDVLRILLTKGADVTAAATGDNRTAAHMAAERGGAAGEQCLVALLESGAAVNAAAADGRTPLHCAAARGSDTAAVRRLLEHGAVRLAVDGAGKTSFDLAVHNAANPEILDALRLGEELRRAARKGDARAVRAAIRRGASVNGTDQNGWTALHCAAFKGHADVARALTERGANVNAVECEGYSPLHCAVETGRATMVRFLLASGANVNGKCKRGVSVVELAQSSFIKNEDVMKLLLDAGAVIEMKNKNVLDQLLLKAKSSSTKKLLAPSNNLVAC